LSAFSELNGPVPASLEQTAYYFYLSFFILTFFYSFRKKSLHNYVGRSSWITCNFL